MHQGHRQMIHLALLYLTHSKKQSRKKHLVHYNAQAKIQKKRVCIGSLEVLEEALCNNRQTNL
jgi:hypothetical protein